MGLDRAVGLGVGIGLIGSFLGAGLLSAADVPLLSGSWKRNVELSQDALVKVAASLPPEGQDAGAEDKRFRDLLFHIAKASDNLEIEQSATDFKIVYGTDGVRIFYPGRQHTREGLLGQKIQAFAHWEGNELIVEEKDDDGVILEKITLREGRLQHILTWQNKRFRVPLLILSVYDRAHP
jgi:hypothetical protein